MSRQPSVTNSNPIRLAAILVSVALIVAILYSAKVVLVPIALAVLLTFVLSPVVTRVGHWGVPRVPSVLVVVGTAGLFFAALGWLVVSQLGSLAADLPNYRDNIQDKVSAFREGTKGGIVEKVQTTIENATEETEKGAEAAATDNGAPPPADEELVRVQIVPEQGSQRAMGAIRDTLLTISPALGGLATGGFVLVLVIFMLINREDLRNRMVSFAANGSLATTTKALDDAGQRISRYLIMQLMINGSFGVAVTVGLMLIGVPYALLWGLCAAVFRYVPYIGPWVAASLPLAISVITSPGWSQVLLVLGLFVVLELISNNVMEPWLYGHGVGISVVALLISAAFWTWIWGSIGLILATPLTVCLVVIGKYVPGLAFLDRLLGDRPALEPHAAFLQRLLARDEQEAAQILRDFVQEHGREIVYDEVLVPALSMARHDRALGNMNADEESYVLETTSSILSQLGSELQGKLENVEATDAEPELHRTNGASKSSASSAHGANSAESKSKWGASGTDQPESQVSRDTSFLSPEAMQPQGRVIGCPAHHEADELTLQMLDQLTRPIGLPVDVVSTKTLPTDVVAHIKRERPSVVVIAALSPGGLIQARFLCKLLRKHFPRLGIVVGCWGFSGNLDRVIVKLRSAGAHHVTTTLLGAQNHVRFLAQTAETPLQDVETPSGLRRVAP